MSVSIKDLKYIHNYLLEGMNLVPSNMNYVEDTVSDFGVVHIWPNSSLKTSITTRRGTKVEIVDKPKWGLTCYMNNSIQSCLKDEKIYHESLVHPVMSSVKNTKRVCIVGGGEGATLREVLRWKDVEIVDMYEWDRDVVQLFRNDYPQWAQGAWNDPRVKIIYSDIFKLVEEDQPDIPYDVIIIDLFDPSYDTGDEEYNRWSSLLKNITKWLSTDGGMVFYSGMRQLPEEKQVYKDLYEVVAYQGEWHGISVTESDKMIIPYKVYIPSFSGESTFIMMKPSHAKVTFNKIKSHLNNDIWNSYTAFNY